MAVSVLRERNLIDRVSLPEGGYLKTHRSLQKSLLYHLDRNLEQREFIFGQALKIVRQAFPQQSLILRGDPTDWPINKRYIPHVAALSTAFEQSDPPMPNDVVFAGLLRDGAYFLWSWHVRDEALQLLKTAQSICSAVYKHSPETAGPILAFIESQLGIHDQYAGVAARQLGIERTERAFTLYQEHTARLKPEDVSKVDYVALGRFHADRACCWIMVDDVKKMDSLCAQAIEKYSQAGPESEMKSRYGVVYCFQALALATQGDHKEALGKAQRGVELITEALGAANFFTLWVKHLLAMVWWRAGDVETALEIHKEVWEGRTAIHPKGHHDILSSQYMLAVAYQRTGDLESAE
jgi:tetratricopeptide (TPR) repeat protein